MPDSTEYQLTYEETPGSCTPLSGTYSPNCVTGRIYQVILPTGGTIAYTYSGGSNGHGIYSDGSTAGLTRALTATTNLLPAQSWSYSRTLVTGTPGPGSTWTTTVVDSNGNNTVLNFAEDATTTTSTTVATYNSTKHSGNYIKEASQAITVPVLLLATVFSSPPLPATTPLIQAAAHPRSRLRLRKQIATRHLRAGRRASPRGFTTVMAW